MLQALRVGAQPNDRQAFVYAYDASGNRVNLNWPGPPGPNTQGMDYVYDREGRLIVAQAYQTNHQGQRVEREVTRLFYDGLGRRLVKEYDPKTGAGGVKRTEYVLDNLDPVVEYSVWNGQREEFYRGGIEAAITDILAGILIGGFAAAGASAEGVGAIPGTILGLKIAWALDVAIASYSLLGQVENILGLASLVATIRSDIAAGYTGFPEGGGLAIGQDTLVSARNMLLGLIPESNIDLAISASQLHYDIERNFMGRPGGSVVFTSPTDWEAWRKTFQVLLKEW